MRHSQLLIIAMATAALCPRFAFAQSVADYPAKPVRIIVGSAVGGGADQTARMFAQKLDESLKGQFVVDNRPGGGDTIATGLTAKSPPDGYTLMVAGPSFTIAPSLYLKFLVDPVKDFVPITLATRAPLILVVHPSLPVKSVKEFIALAKSKPGMVNMAITTASNSHFGTAFFASMANIKVTLVPYKGSGPSVVATTAGEVPAQIVNSLAVMPQIKSERLRPLAVSSADRFSVLPAVPTIAESGLAGYDVFSWYGWVAPAGTPAGIINKLNAEIVRAGKLPDVAKRVTDAGADVVGSTPEQFGKLIATEVARWGKITKELNIRVE